MKGILVNLNFICNKFFFNLSY